jgi:hypothetical protein
MGLVRAFGRPSFQRTWKKKRAKLRTHEALGGVLGGHARGVSAPGLPAAPRQPGSSEPTGESPPHSLVAANAVSAVQDRSVVDWRVSSTLASGSKPVARAPLQAPGTAGSLDGEVLTNKSSQGRADAQRLVATRPLDRLHDPLGHFSRLQRIYPRAR